MSDLAAYLLTAVRFGVTPSKPDRGQLELLPHLAEFEGVTPWLYHRLKQSGGLDVLPVGVAERLRSAALEAVTWNLRVDDQAAALIALLQSAGLPHILLKGVARRALGGHHYHSLRRTADVDLLLPKDAAAAAYELLTRSGYQRVFPDREHSPHHHHLAMLWDERRVGVELHTSLTQLVSPELTWQRMSASARRVEWEGLQVLVPSLTELAWTTVVQAPTDALTLGFRLRELLDFAVLAEVGDLEWKELARRSGLGEAADGDSTLPVPERVLTTWVEAASGRFDLLPLLRWRIRILAARQLRRGVAERLLSESARVTLGLPPLPPPAWVVPPAYRWHLTGRVTRSAFRAWRAVRARGRAGCIALALCCGLVGRAGAQQVSDTLWQPKVSHPMFAAGQGPVVYIDEAHHNFHTMGGRFAPFARLLQADGFGVRRFVASFDQASLDSIRILVISNALAKENETVWARPVRSAFSAAEIDALEAWVKGGGALLLIADHMPLAGAAMELGARFGAPYIDGFALGKTPAEGRVTIYRRADGSLVDHVITNGRSREERVDSIATFTGSALLHTVPLDSLLILPTETRVFIPQVAWQFSDSTPYVVGARLLQGAVRRVGRGRVALFGEAAMFSAQRQNGVTMGLNDPRAVGNAQFVVNLLHWLAGRL